MACEIGDSPFPTSPFDDTWTKIEGSTSDLDAISAFNTSYDQQNSNTIDPALTYSNPSTPQASTHSSYNFTTAPSAELNQTQSPAARYQSYPAPFHAAPASPYFQSVEVDHGPVYQHSALRNEQFGHRRSVSEPPGMPDQQPLMVFHRDEHYLGPTVHHKAMPLKSQHRHKFHRSHPYPASARNPAKYQAHPHSLSKGVDQNGFRPSIQRAYTQPVRQHPPTSAPMTSTQHLVGMSPQHLQRASMHPHAPPTAPSVSDQFRFQSTSRVCTPTPIDPSLSEPPTPSRSSKRQTTLNISMTVDELRDMIFEAVQTAVGGVPACRATEEEEKQQQGIHQPGAQTMPIAVQREEVPDADAATGMMNLEGGA